MSCVGEQAATLTLLPTHFFFIFLFYTDVGSLTLVLAAYLVRFAHLACDACTGLGPTTWNAQVAVLKPELVRSI